MGTMHPGSHVTSRGLRHHNAPGAGHEKGKAGKTRELLGGKGILIKYSRMLPLPPDAQKGVMFHVLATTGQVLFQSRRRSFSGNIQNASLTLAVSFRSSEAMAFLLFF